MSKNSPQETNNRRAVRIGAAVLCIIMAIGVVALAASLIVQAIVS